MTLFAWGRIFRTGSFAKIPEFFWMCGLSRSFIMSLAGRCDYQVSRLLECCAAQVMDERPSPFFINGRASTTAGRPREDWRLSSECANGTDRIIMKMSKMCFFALSSQ